MLNLNIFLKSSRSIVGYARHFRTTGQRREFVPAVQFNALAQASNRCAQMIQPQDITRSRQLWHGVCA